MTSNRTSHCTTTTRSPFVPHLATGAGELGRSAAARVLVAGDNESTSEVEMICFEVWVNGEKLCVAGVGDSGVLNSIVSWVGRQGRQSIKPDLHVGGLVDDEHVRWTEKGHYLEVGDEVIIKIVEADTADEPIRKEPRKTQEQETPS